MAPIVPYVKWAQREDKLFITIEVSDVTNEVIDLKPEGILSFTGKGGPNKEEYAVTLEFHGEIDVAASKRLVNAHQLFFTIQKKEGGDYWPRLLKDKTRQHWLKIDFNKWKDQDDDDEDEKKPDDYNMPGMENFDMSQMMQQMGGGAGGMPGMPGMGGGPEGMDMEKMLEQMKAQGGGGDTSTGADADDAPDSDDDDIPDLE